MTDITIRVDVLGQYKNYVAATKVPDLVTKCFQPIDICDEPMLRAFTASVSSKEAKIVMKVRKDAADLLAKELSEYIFNAMKKDDTTNGYAS